MGNAPSTHNINNLPNELIWRIIGYSHHDPKELSLVCRLWLNMTLSIPALWANIDIQNDGDIRRLPLLLTRSIRTNLTIKIRLTCIDAVVDEPADCRHPTQCHFDGKCFRTFTDDQIDGIIDVLHPHFSRVISLHLNYQPGQRKWASPTWASSVLERFDFSAPILESLVVESGHGEFLPATFLAGNTPCLQEVQSTGQRPWDPEVQEQFLCGSFPLTTLQISAEDSISYDDIMAAIFAHSSTLSSLIVSVPSNYPLGFASSFPQSPTLQMPALLSLNLRGFHFIAGHFNCPNIQTVTLVVEHHERSVRAADSDEAFDEYHRVVEDISQWLTLHSERIIDLKLALGHYRRVNELILSGPLDIGAQSFSNLTHFTLHTNIPTDTFTYRFSIPSLEVFHYSVRMPEGVSFRSLIPWLSHCSRRIKSISVHSARLAPYSTNLLETTNVMYPSLTYLKISTPFASFISGYISRTALALQKENIHTTDIIVPEPSLPRSRRNYRTPN